MRKKKSRPTKTRDAREACKCKELAKRLKTMRETAADVNRDAEALFAARKTLVSMVGRVLDLARALPGLYVVSADGRPAFTSQAAADFVNAINQCAALCTEADPKTNEALHAFVISEANEIKRLHAVIKEERDFGRKMSAWADKADAQVAALQKELKQQNAKYGAPRQAVERAAREFQRVIKERDRWADKAGEAMARLAVIGNKDATEATAISAAMKLPGLYSIVNGAIVYSSEQAATLVRAVGDYERSLNRTPWEERILEEHGLRKPRGLLSKLLPNANKRRQ